MVVGKVKCLCPEIGTKQQDPTVGLPWQSKQHVDLSLPCHNNGSWYFIVQRLGIVAATSQSHLSGILHTMNEYAQSERRNTLCT